MRFIDLFAGIGGFRLVLEKFGHTCVFCSEWDRYSQLTYEKNFGETPKGDITKIKEKNIPKHDILCAGFPCQPFSISGKQKGFNDIRGSSFYEIIRIVKYHKPKILILENVKNLVKHNGGKSLKKIIRSLKSLSYNVFYQILKSGDFGVPQARERVYFICFRKELNITNFKFPTGNGQKKYLKNIINYKENNKNLFIIRKDIQISKSNTSPKSGLIKIGIINKGRQGERIYSINGYAITLSASGGGPAGKTGAYLINGKIRKLSSRECAKVQGYPGSFKIPVSRAQAYKQFGNSVSVPVIETIFQGIEKVIV